MGDGGTADAIRYEQLTWIPVNNRSHLQKGKDWYRALMRIQSKESLSEDEKDLVKCLIDDLEKALKGE